MQHVNTSTHCPPSSVLFSRRVCGGTGGVYAIRTAGMATAVGTWATVMVAVNFVWGFGVFGEPMTSHTTLALGLLVVGVIGMSRATAGQKSPLMRSNNKEMQSTAAKGPSLARQTSSNGGGRKSDPLASSLHMELRVRRNDAEAEHNEQDEMEDLLTKESGMDKDNVSSERPPLSDNTVSLCGCRMSLWFTGILGAIFNGLMAGSSLIPVKFAKEQGYGGANYLLSYAMGALFSNTLMWLCYYAWLAGQHGWSRAYQSMPSWHLAKLYKIGFSAGLLLTIAMLGSIISVTYLGQGIGNSVIQSKIIVSGLWGIGWFREITGRNTIALWFASALLSVLAILWLSAERLAATNALIATTAMDASEQNESTRRLLFAESFATENWYLFFAF